MKTMNNAFVVVNEKFNYIEGNREVSDEKHVRNIMNAMMNGDFIPPIIVDRSTRYIVDGQHRNAAANCLWKQGIPYELPVIFHDFDNPLLAAILYNNKSKEWRTASYVKAFMADNRKSYILLQNFCETHPLLRTGDKFKYSTAVLLLTHGYDSDVLKNGSLVITQEQCVEAEQVYQEMIHLYELVPVIRQRPVLTAWIKCRTTILRHMSFMDYLKVMEQKFVAPASYRVSEWIYAFTKILA